MIRLIQWIMLANWKALETVGRRTKRRTFEQLEHDTRKGQRASLGYINKINLTSVTHSYIYEMSSKYIQI